MAGAAKLLEFLAGGFSGAESGTVEFFTPGTTDPTLVYRDSAALDPFAAEPLDLGAAGQLTVFVARRVRAIIKDADGVVVFDDEPTVTTDRLIDSASDSFAGQTDPVPLSDILRLPLASFGGTNFRYLAFPGETEMNLKDWMGGVHIDGRAFGCRGDDAQDNLDQLLRAIDFCAELGGGIVYLPRGTYRIRDHLIISQNNVELRGEGRTATFIKCMGAAEGIIITGGACTLRNLGLFSSVSFNTGYAVVLSEDETRLLSVYISGWDSGVNLSQAGVTTIIEDSVIFNGAGHGIGITGTNTPSSFGGLLKVGRTEIRSTRIEGQSISAGDQIDSLSGIRIDGTSQHILVSDNFIDKPLVGIDVRSSFTGGRVILRDNHLGASFQQLRIDATTNTGIEQSGNGLDAFESQTSGSVTVSPAWLERGARYKILVGATSTLTVGAPTPTPGVLPGWNAERPMLWAAGGATVTVAWNAIYRRSTSFTSLAAGHDRITAYVWDPTLSKWVETFTGPDIT